MNEGQIRGQQATEASTLDLCCHAQAVPIVTTVSWADNRLRITGLWCPNFIESLGSTLPRLDYNQIAFIVCTVEGVRSIRDSKITSDK